MKSALWPVLLGLTVSCARAASAPGEVEIDAATYTTPTKVLAASDYPNFSDDYVLRGMKLAIARQLKRWESKSLTGTIKLGTKTYPLSRMKQTLQTFSSLIDQFEGCVVREPQNRCFDDLNAQIRARFNVYVPALTKDDPRYGEANWALFTGYHTMPIEGSALKNPDYPHAIYGNPGNPKYYFSRVDIDFKNALAGRGLELLYTKSLFDIYLLHVQGSGKAILMNPDGSKSGFYLNYDGTNKLKWEWISK
jgi:membrane-bound lytic murein transglycosylase